MIDVLVDDNIERTKQALLKHTNPIPGDGPVPSIARIHLWNCDGSDYTIYSKVSADAEDRMRQALIEDAAVVPEMGRSNCESPSSRMRL
jgi:hypothetical protein